MSLNIRIATRKTVLRGQLLDAANGTITLIMVKQSLTHCRSKLKRSEKLNYIDAVQCLGKTKARTPSAIAAGAKTRYDDFVVTHILLTPYTHGNVRSFVAGSDDHER
jgi:hypothetical protein